MLLFPKETKKLCQAAPPPQQCPAKCREFFLPFFGSTTEEKARGGRGEPFRFFLFSAFQHKLESSIGFGWFVHSFSWVRKRWEYRPEDSPFYSLAGSTFSLKLENATLLAVCLYSSMEMREGRFRPPLPCTQMCSLWELTQRVYFLNSFCWLIGELWQM